MLDEFECLYASYGEGKDAEDGEFEKNIEAVEEIRRELTLKLEILADKSEYILMLATS